MDITERLRTMCVDIRRKPIALGHLIPLMQGAAADIESLRAENAHMRREFELAWPDAQRYRYVVHTAPRSKIVPLFESGYTDAEIEALIDKMRSEQ